MKMRFFSLVVATIVASGCKPAQKSAPVPSPVVAETNSTEPAPVVDAGPVERPNDPTAIGAYGWYLGDKAPFGFFFDASEYPRHVCLDPRKGRLSPFYQAKMTCLQDRTICEVELSCGTSDPMAAVESALKQKYGNYKMSFFKDLTTETWETPTARIELASVSGFNGFSLKYESIPLRVKAGAETESSNNAAAAKFSSHL